MKWTYSQADLKFGKMIRDRDEHTCQRCGREGQTECAHCFGRRKQTTRHDPRNACALCVRCHRYLDEHYDEKMQFFLDRLGPDEFEALRILAETTSKRVPRRPLEVGKKPSPISPNLLTSIKGRE